jgi:Tfp pilus assembly protein PilX
MGSKTMGNEAMGSEAMGSYGMKSARLHSKGFTLIASMLMLVLMSGIAIGLMMMSNTEGKVGGTDLQNNAAYHAASGGIEKMASDLMTTLKGAQVTTAAQICGTDSVATAPVMAGVTWIQYSVTPQSGCAAALQGTWGQITGSGTYAGLWAQIIPINMTATANLSGGQEVSMVRQAQIALIPVFQFGVFCEGDCAFFDNPTLDFAGRTHANGDLYLGVAAGNSLTFHDKLEAYGNVVTEYLPNGWTINQGDSADTGSVYIPTASGDCPTPGSATATCVLKAVNTDPAASPYGDGSVTGKGSSAQQTGAAYNTSPWNTFSKTTTNHMLINGNYGSTVSPGTGAKLLSMPFVGGNAHPYEIIRQPPGIPVGVSEDPTSALGASRLYNLAQIHVLLSDDPADLPGGAGDSNNIRLANLTPAQVQLQYGLGAPPAAGMNEWGIPIPTANLPPAASFGAPNGTNTYNLYFAAASNDVQYPCTSSTAGNCSIDWLYAPAQWPDPVPANRSLEGLQPGNVAPIYLNDGTPANLGLCPPTGTYPTTVGVTPPTNCPVSPTAPVYPYYIPPNANGATQYNSTNSTAWSLVDGYLRVEYLNNSGTWVAVTTEWLQLGFARGLTPPTANSAGLPATGTKNPINPNAILLLQEPADRPGTGVWPTSTATAPTCTTTAGVAPNKTCSKWTGATPEVAVDTAAAAVPITPASGWGEWAFGLTPAATVVGSPPSYPTATPQSLTQYNWYPINFYDAREGEPRDSTANQANDTCTTNGVMNAVEIDVGNLQQWLANSTSGKLVNYTTQNGYVLYFSDRRGMLLNPHPPLNPTGTAAKSGDAGLEDVDNANGAGGNAAGTPDGVLEPGTPSPEDVNLNGYLDNFGAQNLGLGFYGTVASAAKNLNTQIVSTNPKPDPYGTAASARIASCTTTGRKNWVSGARHVLRLVDGSLGNLPLRGAALVVTNANGTTTNYWGGFTVAAENPVYIMGDYNSNAADTTWTGGADKAGMAAAGVIADAVTLLSNNWVTATPNGDLNSMTSPTTPSAAANTYWRLAVAGGRNLAFPMPSWEGNAADYPFATDGGIGNFLRLLEDWNGAGATLNYKGSMVSLYNATYGTGIFKCCEYSVYTPPTRNYKYDADFTLPAGLPPGTPMFRDVESLGYRELFGSQ